jgi:hypothetical protein
MPWLHSPTATVQKPGRGREGIHGLTRETDLKGPVHWPRAEGRDCMGQDWGIGFFNEPGGYAIAKVFPNGTQADPGAGQFPKGTVAFKILFTAVDPSALSDLEGAWKIDALVNGGGKCLSARAPENRVLTPVYHVQMDAMMKYGDEPQEWIFGSWIYKKDDTTHWQGMHPVGVQFGIKADETIITSDTVLPNGFAEQGEKPRLNGPADNPMSSCYSCHARAQWPELKAARMPFAPVDNNDRRFVCLLHEWGGEVACGLGANCAAQNDCIPAGKPPTATSGVNLDMSLQFALALRNKQIASGSSDNDP